MKRTMFVVALALLAGCGSTSDAPTEGTADELGASSSAPKLEGGFTVKIDGHTLSYDYELSDINFTNKTVTWNAKLLSNGGLSNATSDVNVKGKITTVARCMGCFSAEIPGATHTLAEVQVSDWKVVHLKYATAEARLTAEATGSAHEPPSTGSPSDRGACTRDCNGDDYCQVVARSECASGTASFPAVRCPSSFTFVKDGACPR